MRAVFLVVGIGGCAGADNDSGGALFLVVVLGLPLVLAIAAFARSALEDRASAFRRAPPEPNPLPPGVEWVYPPHEAGDCRGPETPEDADVED